MPNYTTVLFDADDTLFDTQSTQEIAFFDTYRYFNINTHSTSLFACYKQINEKLWRQLEKNIVSLNELQDLRFARLFEQNRILLNPKEVSYFYTNSFIKHTVLMPYAKEILAKLNSHKIKLAVITNGHNATQEQRIHSLQLNPYIQFIMASEICAFPKPYAEIFVRSIALIYPEKFPPQADLYGKSEEFYLNCINALTTKEKSSILVVGDNIKTDILGASNIGIHSCWFNPKHSKKTKGIKPTFMINQLRDLERILKF